MHVSDSLRDLWRLSSGSRSTVRHIFLCCPIFNVAMHGLQTGIQMVATRRRCLLAKGYVHLVAAGQLRRLDMSMCETRYAEALDCIWEAARCIGQLLLKTRAHLVLVQQWSFRDSHPFSADRCASQASTFFVDEGRVSDSTCRIGTSQRRCHPRLALI